MSLQHISMVHGSSWWWCLWLKLMTPWVMPISW